MKRILILILFIPTITFAQTWSEIRPAGDANKNWWEVAINGDGTVIVAGINNGRLYLSTNSGASWTEQRPGSSDADYVWGQLAVNSDGTKIIAAASGYRCWVYTSGSWTEHYPPGGTPANKTYNAVAISPDGTKMLASTDTRLYYYNGSSWSEVRPAGDVNKAWHVVGINDNSDMLAACGSPGRAYISTNAGSSWSETQPAGNNDVTYRGGALSSDNTKYTLSGLYSTKGRAYKYNGSWSEQTTTGSGTTTSTNYSYYFSSDFSKQITAYAGARLWYYNGSSWTEERPAGDANKTWYGCNISGDGKVLIAAAYGGRMYMATFTQIKSINSVTIANVLKVNSVTNATMKKINSLSNQ